MLAQVIPLKRLPRSLGILSYTVPKELAKKIRPGQLVSIPFRQSTAYGLVFYVNRSRSARMVTRRDAELKPINGTLHEEPLLTRTQLKFIQTMAALYGVSLGTMASMCVLPLQKRKLASITLSPNHAQKRTKNPISHFIRRTKIMEKH